MYVPLAKNYLAFACAGASTIGFPMQYISHKWHNFYILTMYLIRWLPKWEQWIITDTLWSIWAYYVDARHKLYAKNLYPQNCVRLYNGNIKQFYWIGTGIDKSDIRPKNYARNATGKCQTPKAHKVMMRILTWLGMQQQSMTCGFPLQ